MSKSSQRFEILLPRQFNDGQPVPDTLIAETLLELESQFGAVSSETQSIQGFWKHEGKPYRDLLLRVYIDVPDTTANRKFFRAFKNRLKKRFNQLDIRITTFPVEEI